MRINARLNDEYQEKLRLLQAQTGKSASEVVRDALDFYDDASRQHKQSKVAILKQTGFIGVAEGHADLSENYKRLLDGSDKT